VLIAVGCDLSQVDRILDRLELAGRRGQAGIEKSRAGAPTLSLGAIGANDLLAAVKHRERISAAYSASVQESRAAVSEVIGLLHAPQQRRLRQIQLQAAGYEALLWPEVDRELGLTDAQRQQLAAVGDWAKNQMEAASDARVEDRIPESKLRQFALDRALALLSDSQKKTWSRLMGEPFSPLR